VLCCGFLLIKGSLRPATVLVSEPVEDDPVVTFSSGFLTCSSGGVLEVGMPDCDKVIAGLGDPSIDIRDFLEDREAPVPSSRLFVFLILMGELVGNGPRSRGSFPCPFVEVSGVLLRSGAAP